MTQPDLFHQPTPVSETLPLSVRSEGGISIDTRRQAAEFIRAHLNELQQRVQVFLTGRGPHGATDEEIRRALHLQGDTARARRCELRDVGLIVDSGRVRQSSSGRSMIVWVAAVSQEMPPASTLTTPSRAGPPSKPAAADAQAECNRADRPKKPHVGPTAEPCADREHCRGAGPRAVLPVRRLDRSRPAAPRQDLVLLIS